MPRSEDGEPSKHKSHSPASTSSSSDSETSGHRRRRDSRDRDRRTHETDKPSSDRRSHRDERPLDNGSSEQQPVGARTHRRREDERDHKHRDFEKEWRSRQQDSDHRPREDERDRRYRNVERDRRPRDVDRDRRPRDSDRDRHREQGRDRNTDRDIEHRRRDERGASHRDTENRKRPRVEDGPTAEAAPADNGAPPAAEPQAEPVRKAVNTGKTGGVYIPPFKLARMLTEVESKVSPEYQRLTWEALKKSINGIVNKVNSTNIKNMLGEVFKENLVRGRGLFCRSMMKSQMASPTFTPVYAALVAVVNTKFPEIGELLLSRLILQFKRSFKRNDKPVCTAACRFLGHLCNQGVAHEVLALEILILMLQEPSEDGVELAVEFVKEVGAFLQEVAPQGLHSVFERFRAILHEGAIAKRVQFIIEGLFAIRKAGFDASGFKAVKPELDLVDTEDQITHELGLDDELDAQMGLDVFQVDPNYEEEEKKYGAISREILGEESDDGDGAGEGEDADDESEEDKQSGDGEGEEGGGGGGGIHDETQTNLVNLRRTIYLTLMSSFDFEEAGHKLLKIQIQPGQEIELVTMVIECCSQERTYKRFFGLLAQRFCYINRTFRELYEDCFRQQYSIIHRLETNKLRNVACLFAHMLATDALEWSVLSVIRLTEEETTSSSRIFIKYLFQELSSTMGLVKLNARLNDPTCGDWFDGVFPKDTLANMRFSINFFTSIGLGGVTDAMRERYKQAVANAAQAQAQAALEAAKAQAAGSSSSSGSSSSDSDSSSGSDLDSDSSSSSDSD